MLNNGLTGFHTHTLNSGLNVADWIDRMIEKSAAFETRIYKFLLVFILVFIGALLAPFLYILSLYIIRDVRNRARASKTAIPSMSLEELARLLTSFNTAFEKHDLQQIKESFAKGSILSAPIRISLSQLVQTIIEVQDIAKAQINRDLAILSEGWEDEIPTGIVPFNIKDENDWY